MRFSFKKQTINFENVLQKATKCDIIYTRNYAQGGKTLFISDKFNYKLVTQARKEVESRGLGSATMSFMLLSCFHFINNMQNETKDTPAIITEINWMKSCLSQYYGIQDTVSAYNKLDAFVKSPEYVDSEQVSRYYLLTFKLKRENIKIENLLEEVFASLSPKAISAIGAKYAKKTTTSQKPQDSQSATEETKEDLKTEDKDPLTDDFFDELFEESQKKKPKKTKKEFKTDALMELIRRVKSAQKSLLTSVFGQDHAVNNFINGYFNAEYAVMTGTLSRQPRAVFFFCGPPGVGKTFLAEKSAEVLNLPFRRFDMSEYADKEANFEFAGSDKVYKNGSSGNVTSFVAKNPNAILLFDEVEKAHLNIIHLFLQILDAGRLRDNFTDEEVSFTNNIIIFTTNVGKELYEDENIGLLSALPKKTIIKAIAEEKNPVTNNHSFPSAIVSRLASNNVVMFDHMVAHNLATILTSQLNKATDTFTNNTGIKIDLDEKIASAIIFSLGGSCDARTVKGRGKNFFMEEIYELFRLLDKENLELSSLKKIKFNIDFTNAKKDVINIFEQEEKPNVLVFCDKTIFKKVNIKSSKIKFLHAETIVEAQKILKDKNITLILSDITFEAKKTDKRVLNVEDLRGLGNEFLVFHERYCPSLPLFLLEYETLKISFEEKQSFARRGVRGFVDVTETGDRAFVNRLVGECQSLHQQQSMELLAKNNKVLSFDTEQSLSLDGTEATIDLFDLKLELALNSADNKKVISDVQKPNVKFSDVIGAEDAKGELAYFIEYLKNPKKFAATGIKPPKGVLLYGPPGTGKTMLAKAMAGEGDITFIAAEGNDFLKRYVGEGPEEVHRLFKTARRYAPAILFIDEIDAIATSRDQAGSGGGSSSAATLTAFLTEMDGFKSNADKPVFVLAATNFSIDGGKNSIDPALLRRFDRKILVDLPNKEERERFLKAAVAKNKLLELTPHQITNIATRSTAMSLSDLSNIIELALREAIKRDNAVVDDKAFDEAFETYNSGEKKNWSEQVVLRTARHEAGHALVNMLEGTVPSYLTIVSRAKYGGYMQMGDEEKFGYTKSEILKQIRVCLAGRAAEMVYYGEEEGLSTGPSQDIFQATKLCEALICDYGMDEEFGLSYIDMSRIVDNAIAKSVRERVNVILKEQLDKAVMLIKNNIDMLDALVESLFEKNSLIEAEMQEILDKFKK